MPAHRRQSASSRPLAPGPKNRLRCRKISPWEDVDASIDETEFACLCRCRRIRAGGAAPAQAQSGQPITIGFGMALTGPLAANGKQTLLGMKIWEEEINAKGGLLGRPVKLVYYDDQSNPSTVPGIYTKLIDVDKVNLVVSGYATNMVAPAMPVVMQKNKVFPSLFALDVNARVQISEILLGAADRPEHQDRRSPKASSASALEQNPKPTDGRARGRGRGVLQQRLRRRPRERQEAQSQDRLRQELSAEHDRLHADRARAAGGQSRSRRRSAPIRSARSASSTPSTS